MLFFFFGALIGARDSKKAKLWAIMKVVRGVTYRRSLPLWVFVNILFVEKNVILRLGKIVLQEGSQVRLSSSPNLSEVNHALNLTGPCLDKF